MKLIHSPTSMNSALAYVYLFQDRYSKGYPQDKAMQELLEAMDNVPRKVRAKLCSGIANCF